MAWTPRSLSRRAASTTCEMSLPRGRSTSTVTAKPVRSLSANSETGSRGDLHPRFGLSTTATRRRTLARPTSKSLQRLRERLDVGRGGPAAAADEPGAGLGELYAVLGEVVRVCGRKRIWPPTSWGRPGLGKAATGPAASAIWPAISTIRCGPTVQFDAREGRRPRRRSHAPPSPASPPRASRRPRRRSCTRAPARLRGSTAS